MESDNQRTDDERRIHVGERRDGEDVWFPVERILTGRAFVTGKSGSGKSNTASVIVEELLEGGYAVLIVDTDGEYYGLKEEYELLHAGADEECDVQVDVEHAEKLATLALEENVPVILDVSGFLDEDQADELLRETARHLFAKEKKLKRPFLLVVEEVHEYIPEGAGMGETGKMLIKIGKRGRKHGLGILGISQRPADVKKDFITQANWLVWHRLTWENDTKVVKRIVGSEYGDMVSDLDAGQAFAQFDWTDQDVTQIQFKRKRTFDAGATPGLDDFERPDLKSVSEGLMDDLSEISEQKRREQDRVEELEEELKKKEATIEDLQRELDRAEDVSTAAEQMAEAVADGLPNGYQAKLGAKNEEIDRLHSRVAELEARIEEVAMALSDDDTVDMTLPEFEEVAGDADDAEPEDRPDLFADFTSIETYLDDARESGRNGDGTANGGETTDPVAQASASGTGSDGEVPAQPPVEPDPADADGSGRRIEAGDDWPDPDAPDPGDDAASAEATPGDWPDPDGPGSGTADAGSPDPDATPAVVDDDDATFIDAEAVENAEESLPGTDGDGGGGDGGQTAQLEASATQADVAAATPDPAATPDTDHLATLLREPAVASKLRAAVRESQCNEDHTRTIVAKLAADGPIPLEATAAATEVGPESAYSLLSALRARDLVDRDERHRYSLAVENMERIVENADDRAHLGELRKQWEIE